MSARFRIWWEKIRKHPVALVIVLSVALGIALLVVLVLGYIFNWGWTGLGTYIPPTKDSNFQRGKTLWDWLQLLIVPLVLAIGGFWLSQMQKKTEQRITTDNQREVALQSYIDKISELLLKEHLGEKAADGKLRSEYEQVGNVARVRTITILKQLDGQRASYVFAFLREARLMSPTSNDDAVSLKDADLREVNWSQADLRQANLSGADLWGADLSGAILKEADLSGAILKEANLSGANLLEANLSLADLLKADLSEAYLGKANLSGASLHGTNLLEANLSETNLSLADLRGANLSGAWLRSANLKDASYFRLRDFEKPPYLEGATMPDGSKHP